MAKTDTFQCSVVTPEKAVLECDAKFVAFPAHDGEMGVLRNRAPLVCKLGIGVLRVETLDEKHVMFVDGGFAQVLDNRLAILTEQARYAADIDHAGAEQALVEARAMSLTGEEAVAARAKAVRRARIQLTLANSEKPDT